MTGRRKLFLALLGALGAMLVALWIAHLGEEAHRRLDRQLYDAAMAGRPDEVARLLARGASPRAQAGDVAPTGITSVRKSIDAIARSDEDLSGTILGAMNRRIAAERTRITASEQAAWYQRSNRADLPSSRFEYPAMQNEIEARVDAHMAPFVRCRHLLQEADRRP